MLPRFTNIEDTILVTHMGCMDGSGCVIMFLRAGGKLENVRFVSAGTLGRFVKKDLLSLEDKFIIFSDIGFSEEHGEKYAGMLEKRGNIVLLDHHVTSNFLKTRTWAHIVMEFCGTELTRQYLGLEDESSKALSAIIQDHDLWKRNDPRSVDLAAFTVFVGQDVFVQRFKDRDITKELFTSLEKEMMDIVLRRRDQFIAAAVKKVVIKDVEWGASRKCKVGYVISSEMNVSLLLDNVLEKYPEIDVSCQINFERSSVSLRARQDGYDVSEMAKYYGGGGHKAASGHRITEFVMDSIYNDIH